MTTKSRTKRTLTAIQWGVDQGALTKQQARAAVVLGVMSGAIRTPDAVASQIVRGLKKEVVMAKLKAKTPASLKGTAAGKLFNGVSVKDATSRLCEKKYPITKNGQALKWAGRPCETASEKDNAIIGVWFKRLMQKSGVPGIVMTEFEKSVLAEQVTKGRWVGDVNGRYYGGADPSDFAPVHEVKALLDDTASGGIFLTPYEYDSNVVTLPLLSGQVFPMVDLVPVTARRIEGAKMQNMTLQWGNAAGTQITPFNTAALVSELATPVYPVAGAIELSNEMLADSPVNVGAKVTELFSERLKSELDRVVVSGNGYNEPLGILNTTGLVTVPSDFGASGPPTVSDYEALTFAVQKQYRESGWNPAFVSNDTTYRRARGIQVGSGDERRVFGTNDQQEYKLLGYDAKIQNDVTNSKIIFGCWKRYRMFQRLGSEVTVEQGGRTLRLANTSLVVIRSRFGGQPIDGNAFALMNDAQA